LAFEASRSVQTERSGFWAGCATAECVGAEDRLALMYSIPRLSVVGFQEVVMN